VQRPPDVQAETVTITDPLTVQVADLFNAIYETTLQALSRYSCTVGRPTISSPP
jgi:hypothetical protein